MKLDRTIYETLKILGISLTDTTPLQDLFNKSNFSIDKELDGFYCLLEVYPSFWVPSEAILGHIII